MARSKSSGRWLDEHFNDQYVKKSQQDGYRSRASYKLLELQNKDKLFKPGMAVLDLGSAPGGWSQVAMELVGKKGRVVASDILPMEPIEGVDFVEGDFTELVVYEQIIQVLGGKKVDLVISDMAPNMSGVTAVDQPKAMYLVELSVDMVDQILSPGGCFIAKVFHGDGFDELLKTARSKFNKVQIRKPDASRARSKEQYLVASGFKG
jgi:23S rRNA (uridine2552-2'-O)-methyltransferase